MIWLFLYFFLISLLLLLLLIAKDKEKGTCGIIMKGKTVFIVYEPVHEISNNVVCATSKASDQPTHMGSLIRAFASHLNIL